MYGTTTRRNTGALASASRGSIRLAQWALLAFTNGTVLCTVLQRHLLEPLQGARVQQFVDLNVGELFGAAAVASLLLTEQRSRPALTRADIGVLVACAMTWLLPETGLLPEPRAVYVGMTLAAVWLLARHSADRQLRDVAQVWLALSFCELCSKLAFKFVYGVIGPFEVWLMHGVGSCSSPAFSQTAFPSAPDPTGPSSFPLRGRYSDAGYRRSNLNLYSYAQLPISTKKSY